MPIKRISTPGATRYKRPRPQTGQRSPAVNSSWRHSTRAAPLYASAPQRPWPGRRVPAGSALSLAAVDDPTACATVRPSRSREPEVWSVCEDLRCLDGSPNTRTRSRLRLNVASCKANSNQKYHWSTRSNTRRSSAVKASPASRVRNASPSWGLSLTSSGRCIVGNTSAERQHMSKGRTCLAGLSIGFSGGCQA